MSNCAIASSRPTTRRFAVPLLLAGALALPSPALAAWETINVLIPNTPDRCSGNHAIGRQVLRSSDRRALRVITGARATLEIFGHGIDLNRASDIGIEGGFGGISAQYQGGTGGAANAARRCGTIGSIKLLLDVPPLEAGMRSEAERSFTLRIGSDRIPVTVRLPVDFRMRWDAYSHRSGSEPLSPDRQAPAAPPPPPPPQLAQPGTPSPECLTGQTTCMIVTGPPGGGSPLSSDAFKQRSLAQCIIGKGGDARLEGNRLEILLPDGRASAAACFERYSFTDTSQWLVGAVDIGPGRNDWQPGIRYAITGGNEVNVSHAPEDPETGRVGLSRNFALRFVGVRDFQVQGTNFAGRTLSLDLRIQSVTPYGVTDVALANVPTNPGSLTAGRFNPTAPGARPAPSAPAVTFTAQLAQTNVTNRPLEWSVLGADGRPAPGASACFAAMSGTVSPDAGANRVSFNVARSSETACAGQSFTLRINPPGRGSGLYGASTVFTLR